MPLRLATRWLFLHDIIKRRRQAEYLAFFQGDSKTRRVILRNKSRAALQDEDAASGGIGRG